MLTKDHPPFFFPPDEAFQKKANVKDLTLYKEAARDPIAFWEDCAENLCWFTRWSQGFRGTFVHPEWFVGGKLNASYNCLDRHLNTDVCHKTAIFWEGEKGESRSLSYLDLYRDVCRFANALKELGVKKGDHVAIFLPLIPETVIAMLAVARLGAVHTVIFGGIGPDGIYDRIVHAEATILITVDGGYRRNKIIPFKQVADQILDKTNIRHVVVVERTKCPIPMKEGRDFFYSTLIQKASDHCPAEPMDSEDPLFILYTSGSTGKPKGIYHTTGGYLTGVHATCQWVFDLHREDVYWCTADPGWITGHSYVVYGPLMFGVTQLLYEGAFDIPDPGRIWRMIEQYKVNIFYTAPTAIRTFIKHGHEWPQKFDLSSLRLLASVGEPINPDVWLWYREVIGKNRCPVVDTWFQTETGAVMIAPLPGVSSLKPGSAATPIPGIQAAVLDDQGGRTTTGSLALLAPFPSMMRGCYRDEEKYLATYWSKWDGKYYSAGDAAQQDEEGYFWMTGRQDEVLKVSGHRIGTAEVESALVDHQAVAEAAVVGIEDPITGERIHAFVTLKAGAISGEFLQEELKAIVVKKIGSYARPFAVICTPDLPKTRSGKIMRRILKSLIEKKPLGDTITLENPQAVELLKQLIS